MAISIPYPYPCSRPRPSPFTHSPREVCFLAFFFLAFNRKQFHLRAEILFKSAAVKQKENMTRNNNKKIGKKNCKVTEKNQSLLLQKVLELF